MEMCNSDKSICVRMSWANARSFVESAHSLHCVLARTEQPAVID